MSRATIQHENSKPMGATVTGNSNREIDMASLCRPIVDSSPMPMAAVEGADHIIRALPDHWHGTD